jgi:hypothetical protein
MLRRSRSCPWRRSSSCCSSRWARCCSCCPLCPSTRWVCACVVARCQRVPCWTLRGVR